MAWARVTSRWLCVGVASQPIRRQSQIWPQESSTVCPSYLDTAWLTKHSTCDTGLHDMITSTWHSFLRFSVSSNNISQASHCYPPIHYPAHCTHCIKFWPGYKMQLAWSNCAAACEPPHTFSCKYAAAILCTLHFASCKYSICLLIGLHVKKT